MQIEKLKLYYQQYASSYDHFHQQQLWTLQISVIPQCNRCTSESHILINKKVGTKNTIE